MKTIFKYPIEITNIQEVKLPVGFKVIHVGLDPNNTSCIWCEVDTNKELIRQTVYVVGTGHKLPPDAYHVGSFLQRVFVWHVYIKE